MNVAIACGGTGGHLFPGIAVGQALRDAGHDVTLWVSGRDVEQQGLSRWDGAVTVVPARGFSGGPLAMLQTCAALGGAVLRAWWRMRECRPDVLLAMGSYASVGPVLAARCLRVPVVLHEANATPGKALSFLARFAMEVCTTFESTASLIKSRQVTLTGLPMSISLPACERDAADASDNAPFVLLVCGGSQGAAILNETVPVAMSRVVQICPNIHIIHLCGSGRDAEVTRAYEKAGISHRVYGFSKDMAPLYRRADVAICRAGAATCCELALFALPAILVPHPTAGGGHQRQNASALQAMGGAEMIMQDALTAEGLAERIVALIGDADSRHRMREGAARLARPEATQAVVQRVLHHATASSRR